jgi:hypothetical protein
MGLYLVQVLDANGRTWLDPVLRPVERATYRLMGVDSKKEHNWKQYTLAMLLFSLVGCVFTYAILRFQHILPLNLQGLAAVKPDLAFNTAASFTTNTNWQNYGGAIDALILLADGRDDISQFRLISYWHRHCRCPRQGDCASFCENDRQLLDRSGSGHLLPAAADLFGLRSIPGVARA